MENQRRITEFIEAQNRVLLEMLQMKYLSEPIKIKIDLKSYSPLPPTKKINKILKDGGFLEEQ